MMGTVLSSCIRFRTYCHDKHLEWKSRFDFENPNDPSLKQMLGSPQGQMQTLNIFAAVEQNDIGEVSRHLNQLNKSVKSSTDWTPINTNSETPLHLACRLGHVPVANLLLDNTPSTLMTRIGSPIHCLLTALDSGCITNTAALSLLYRLLHAGCQINGVDNKGQTALFQAVEQSNITLVEALIDNGASVNICESERGFTPLHMASHNGHITCLYAVLDAPHVSLDEVDNRGYTPLHIAMLQLLDWVEHEPRPNFLYTSHATPNEPVRVCRYNRIAIVEALINAGADPNVSDVHMSNPLVVSQEILAMEISRYGSVMGCNAAVGNSSREASPGQPGASHRQRSVQESMFAPMIRLLVISGACYPEGYQEMPIVEQIDWVQDLYRDRFWSMSHRSEPHQLQHLCRQAIRCQLGKVSRLHCVAQLPLPARLLQYVQI